ncbi:MAG: transposase zinc-binding domain-containing protein, partial [Bacteroidales bacterium]|nr:transposase zinc-binding domain-containing protein [Bacteroidales bacterium]
MAGTKNKYELAGLVKGFGKALIDQQNLSPQQTKALFNILQCRTASLGGHEEVCDCCGKIRYSYNSCGDRHCPKCQNTKQAIWIEKLINTTLAVKHYHIIFTVPHCLNDVCLWNDRMYYNTLFSAVWRTLHSFGYTHFGVETGAVAVLHTWGENLMLHPHLHCIVPAAGYSLKGQWKNIGKYENYLYPVHQLSDTFKGKFLDSLKRALTKKEMPGAFDRHIQKAYNTRWVVHSEASLAEAEHV